MKSLEELKAKHAEELAKAETELTVREWLTQAGAPEPAFVHVGNAYPVIYAGGINYGEFRQTFSPDDVIGIMQALPPVPMGYAEYGYTGKEYRCTAPLALEAETVAYLEKKNRNGSADKVSLFHEIAPVCFELDDFGTACEWFALVNGAFWKVSVKVSSGPYWGALGIQAKRGYTANGPFVENVRLMHGAGELFSCSEVGQIDVINQAGEWAGQSFCVRYASGSSEHIGKHSLWFNLAGVNTATPADFVRAVHSVRAQ